MTDNLPYAACIDIGGTKALLALIDQDGRILAQDRYLLGSQRMPYDIVKGLHEHFQELVLESDLAWSSVVGVGCSIAAILDETARTVLFAPNIFASWEEVPFQSLLAEAFGKPVRLEMDANAAALGEAWMGAGADTEYFAYVVVGTGVGMSLLLHGDVYKGWRGTAGELGHTTIVPDGPPCNCGNYGCLEALASGPAIAYRAQQVLRQGRPTRMREMTTEDNVTPEIVFQAARSGDELAQTIVRQTADYLGIGIANILHILNPEIVVLGGGVMRGGADLLLTPIRESLARRCASWIDLEATRVVPAELGEEAALLGAARLIWKEQTSAR